MTKNRPSGLFGRPESGNFIADFGKSALRHGSDRLVLHELEALVVGTAVEFAAAIVAGDRALDRADAVNDAEAIRANVRMVALHATTLEGQRVERFLAMDAELGAGGLPFIAVRIDVPTTAALIGDEVGELVLERAPKFFGLAVA